jgi:hypothetical protein
MPMAEKKTDVKQESSSPSPDPKELYSLARIIIAGSFAIMIVIILLFFFSTGSQAMQTILTATLPLLGAWVGAVIAFYFSSKNLESATKSVQSLVAGLSGEEKLKTTPTKDVMIPKKEMFFVAADDDSKILLSDLITKLESSGKGDRIPILNSKEFPRFVVHRSTIDKFTSSAIRAAASPSTSPQPISTLTLKQLIDDQPDLPFWSAVAPEECTLADIKAKMTALGKQCQDVFITTKGSRTEPVVGWVTNVIIEKNSAVTSTS